MLRSLAPSLCAAAAMLTLATVIASLLLEMVR